MKAPKANSPKIIQTKLTLLKYPGYSFRVEGHSFHVGN